MSDEREFPVTFDPKRGAIVALPTECPICHAGVGQSYDVHMVMAHPETRPSYRPHLDNETKPKKKKRR